MPSVASHSYKERQNLKEHQGSAKKIRYEVVECDGIVANPYSIGDDWILQIEYANAEEDDSLANGIAKLRHWILKSNTSRSHTNKLLEILTGEFGTPLPRTFDELMVMDIDSDVVISELQIIKALLVELAKKVKEAGKMVKYLYGHYRDQSDMESPPNSPFSIPDVDSLITYQPETRDNILVDTVEIKEEEINLPIDSPDLWDEVNERLTRNYSFKQRMVRIYC